MDTVKTLGTVDTLEKVVQVEIVDTEGRSVHRGIQWDTVGETVDTVDTVAH